MICLCLEKLVRFSGMKDSHTFILTCDPLLDLFSWKSRYIHRVPDPVFCVDLVDSLVRHQTFTFHFQFQSNKAHRDIATLTSPTNKIPE